jgi:hypothetical protein
MDPKYNEAWVNLVFFTIFGRTFSYLDTNLGKRDKDKEIFIIIITHLDYFVHSVLHLHSLDNILK